MLKKWRKLAERKRNSMPKNILTIRLSLALAFLLLVFGVIGILSALKDVKAQASKEVSALDMVKIKVTQPLNNDDVKKLIEEIEIAEKENSSAVLVEFNSTKIDKTAALELTKFLARDRQVHTIAYVHNRVESLLIIPLLAFEERIFTFDTTLDLKVNLEAGFISEARSVFAGSVKKGETNLALLQKQQYSALIEKWGDSKNTLYRKIDKNIVRFSITETEGYAVWIKESKPLILVPSEAKQLGMASITEENNIDNFLLEKGYEIKKTLNLNDKQRTPASKTKRKNLTDEKIKNIIGGKAYIIGITTQIDDVLFESLERRTKIALKEGADIIIFELDTPGGRISSTLKITKLIQKLNKDITTIAWVSVEAISAGAMIAVTCEYIIMDENTKIGDCQPIMPTGSGDYKVAGEKIQTYLRAHFRLFAHAHGIPEVLGEAMVTQELEIVEVKPKPGKNIENYERFMSFDNYQKIYEDDFDIIKIICPKDQLLTLTDIEARDYGFAVENIMSLEDLKRKFKIKTLERLETSSSEEILRFLNSIAPIIIGLGLLGLFIELKTPGFGFFGFLGIAIIAGFFGIKFLVGLAEY